jgi:hypothetical protein
MKKIKVELVIEKGDDELWGSVKYNDNLITDAGKNIPDLEEKFKKLLNDFEGVDPENIEFIHLYDVYALFQEFDFLNISKIADRVGINPGLMRQYASGVKHPSIARAKEIENVLHELAAQLGKTLVYAA